MMLEVMLSLWDSFQIEAFLEKTINQAAPI